VCDLEWLIDENPGVLEGGDEALPGITLRLEKLDQLSSQVWDCFISIGHKVETRPGGPSATRLSFILFILEMNIRNENPSPVSYI